MVADGVVADTKRFRHRLADFDPLVLSGADCAVIAEELAVTEKVCAAARAAAAARAVGLGAHRGRGFANGVDWLARHTGSTSGQARMALDIATAVAACPDTKRALFVGQVSLAQAQEITHAQADVPGAESDLLELAKRSGLAAVRDQARRIRAAAADPDQLHARQRRAREFRWWRDSLGMIRYTGAFIPEVGVPIMNRVDAECDRLRRTHRHDVGGGESRGAYAADAMAALLAGTGPTRPARTELVIVCDLALYRRGHAHPGEVCHIIGGGPIPVERARYLAEDAFIKAVLHDGTRIETVAHFGRHINAKLRTALELGPPPRFEGAACEDCGRRSGLQWDHVNPVANHGPTSFANIEARCWSDHQAKTERDRQTGLLTPSPP